MLEGLCADRVNERRRHTETEDDEEHPDVSTTQRVSAQRREH